MMRHKISGEKSQKGQALIIILLVMSVVLTVVLSSVSRSVTEVVVTGYEEDALRAFSAAEAGVEERLLNLGTIGTIEEVPLDPLVSYKTLVDYDSISGDEDGKQIKYPNKLSSGETATFWFVSQDEDGNFICGSGNPCWSTTNSNHFIFVCYGSGTSTPPPAVEISFYYDMTFQSIGSPNNYADVSIIRMVYDLPEPGKRIPGSWDPLGSCNFDDGTSFAYRARIGAGDAFPAGCFNNFGCPLFVKVRMLFAEDQPVGLQFTAGSPADIPPQGVLISSEGTAGDSVRRVEVYRSYPEPHDLFDLAVFSLGELTK